MEDGVVLRDCDVGHRVVVRRRLSGRTMTDLVGTLVAADHAGFVIRAEDGTEHTVPTADVVAGKRIPPRPARYSEIHALERVADRCWPAPEHERLGDWYLRAAQGWTNRANSALPLGSAGVPMSEALEATRAWYARRGLTPRITVPLPLRRDVARALTDWYAQPRVLVQAAALDFAAPSPDVVLREEPTEQFLGLVAARKQSLPEAAMRVLMGAPLVRFAHWYAGDGALTGIARGAVVEGWLHLSVVEVVEAARRTGVARELSRALADWGRSLGATRAVLQVEEHNAAAVALYAGLGFTTHHTYITYADQDASSGPGYRR
jgi:ribosomal protein S18 acetylase RimI-like enzyme